MFKFFLKLMTFILGVLFILSNEIFARENLEQIGLLSKFSDSINTDAHEYWVTVTADDSTIIFNRLIKEGGIKQEDFYTSTRKKDGEWTKAIPITSLNTDGNEGAQAISADGRFMVFTACGRQEGYGSCDLYYSIKIGDTWIKPRNMGPKINTDAWETQPSLSADGTELYFVSNKEGGKGKMDIWYSFLKGIDEEGLMQWSEPQNLDINTKESEMSPFIHHDNQTLYFSSRGYGGFGGFDVFVSRKKDSIFTQPINMGKLVNTKSDEIGLVVNTAGTTAYFASDRQNFNNDIYSLILPYESRPKEVHYIKGKVLDKNGKAPLLAYILLQNLENEKEMYQTYTDWETGEYLICVKTDKQWALSIQADKHLFYSEHIDLRNNKQLHNVKNIKLSPLALGEKVSLRNIFFDIDKSTLQPTSTMELKRLLQLLEKHSTLKLEISGHTDSSGRKGYNQTLSENRALSVYRWLVENGIAKDRLTWKGYGDNIPIAPNSTPEGKAQNRRTEMKVIGF